MKRTTSACRCKRSASGRASGRHVIGCAASVRAKAWTHDAVDIGIGAKEAEAFVRCDQLIEGPAVHVEASELQCQAGRDGRDHTVS